MNKLLKTIICLLFITSCAQQVRNSNSQKFENIAHDPIQTESLERLAWSNNDLKGQPQALVSCYQGKFKEGLQQLRMMTGKEKDPNYWNMVGSCYYWNKDFNKAKFYFGLGLSIQDNNTDLLHNLALVELMQGRVHIATKELNQILQKDTGALLPRWNLALIYYSNKSPELAIAQLKLLTTVIPNDPLVGLLTIKSQIALEDYDSAVATYARIPSQYKEYAEFQNVYIYSLLKKQSLTEAEKIIKNKSKDVGLKKDHDFRSALLSLLDKLQKTAQRKVATQEGGK